MSVKQDKKIEGLLEEGLTLTEIENTVKVPYLEIKKVADDIGWDVSWRNKKDKYEMHTEKYDTVYDLIVNQKKTLQEVGNKFGVSRERVRQILVDMDIRIRDIKHEKELEIREEIYDLLVTGEYTPKEVAKDLDVSTAAVDRVMKTFTPTQIDRYRANFITREFQKTKEKYEYKMEIALEMWDEDVPTEEIAHAMGIERAYLNQLIIKCRKRYGWFPAKYAARFEPINEDEVIKDLIRIDRLKRQPKVKKKTATKKK